MSSPFSDAQIATLVAAAATGQKKTAVEATSIENVSVSEALELIRYHEEMKARVADVVGIGMTQIDPPAAIRGS